MAILLVGSLLKLWAKSNKLHFLLLQLPGLVQIAFLKGRPQVPQHFQIISIVLMQKFGSQSQGAFRIRAVIEGLLKKDRLVPGNTVYRQIANAALLRRSRKLVDD